MSLRGMRVDLEKGNTKTLYTFRVKEHYPSRNEFVFIKETKFSFPSEHTIHAEDFKGAMKKLAKKVSDVYKLYPKKRGKESDKRMIGGT